MTSSVRCFTSSSERPICRGPKLISSSTLLQNSCTSEFWKMKPTRWWNFFENVLSFRDFSLMTSPSNLYVPSSA